jgi:hypothetical protein
VDGRLQERGKVQEGKAATIAQAPLRDADPAFAQPRWPRTPRRVKKFPGIWPSCGSEQALWGFLRMGLGLWLAQALSIQATQGLPGLRGGLSLGLPAVAASRIRCNARFDF